MRRANVGRNPQAQEEPTQRRGKIAARHTSYPPRITIKGHLTRTPILAQESDHRFQRRLFVEILSSLSQQSDRGPCIQKITDFDHMLTLALRALFTRAGAYIIEIHLDLFQWLSGFVGVGWLFRARDQAAGDVQDLPDRATGAGQRNLCALQLWVTRKVVEQGPRPRHTLQILGRSKAHLHNLLCDTDIPAEVGRM